MLMGLSWTRFEWQACPKMGQAFHGEIHSNIIRMEVITMKKLVPWVMAAVSGICFIKGLTLVAR